MVQTTADSGLCSIKVHMIMRKYMHLFCPLLQQRLEDIKARLDKLLGGDNTAKQLQVGGGATYLL